MYTKIRFLGSSSKRKFVRYEIPTAQWLSNNSTERATVVKLGRKAFKLLSICSFTIDKKLQLVWFLSAHPSSVLQLRMLAAASQFYHLNLCSGGLVQLSFHFLIGDRMRIRFRSAILFPPNH